MDGQLDRLTRLIGSDEGFYVLALHSFVEWYLRTQKGYGQELNFPELTWRLREEILAESGDHFVDGLTCLGRLGKQHFLTNQVRHAFEVLDAEEAASATHLFITFCALVGLGDRPEVRRLAESLEGWSERTSIIDQRAILKQLQNDLELLQEKNRDLLRQKSAFDAAQDELRALKIRIAQYDLDLDRERRRAGEKDVKVDELRRERHELILERKRLEDRISGFDDLQRYLRYLARFSIYTRTRMDYERSITQLTPEQEEVASAINLKRDFLVKGGAGTGKSLVLIEALRRASMQTELDFEEGEYIAFVTFTRTLARYNQYLSALVGMNVPVKLIRTVDSLFYRLLKELDPDYGYNYDAVANFVESELVARGAMVSFLTPDQLTSEIENYLFANNISRKEYVDEMAPRRGMPHGLSAGEREIVWEIRDRIADSMEQNKAFGKSYSRIKILDHLAREPRVSTISYLFLDEVQDLTAVDLTVLKLVTKRAMIMAGDADQSLYTSQMPFARAGINISGTTRILKTNFRNTCQIHAVAEAFRKRAPAGTWDTTNEPFAFREGPLAEIYRADGEPELLSLLVEKAAVFLDELGYEPENVAILVPRNVEVENVTAALAGRGIAAESITAPDFAFEHEGSVRISTLHSSKGLDFPVVLVYLPYLHRRDIFDAAGTERLTRNLIYVGLTRAMDSLNVFLVPQDDPVLRDLESSFGR